jgi:hypothetical protein
MARREGQRPEAPARKAHASAGPLGRWLWKECARTGPKQLRTSSRKQFQSHRPLLQHPTSRSMTRAVRHPTKPRLYNWLLSQCLLGIQHTISERYMTNKTVYTVVLGCSALLMLSTVGCKTNDTTLPPREAVTVERTFPMNKRISTKLTGCTKCSLVKGTSKWSPWSSGDDNWRSCDEYPRPDVEDNYVSSDFDHPNQYDGNRGECTYVFRCTPVSDQCK